MKINELTITRDFKTAGNLNFPSNEDNFGLRLKQLLIKNGRNVLGSGMEGAVIEYKNLILKVFPTNSKYSEFVTLVKNYHNPHFPKFYKFTKQIPGTKFSYVIMEKLTKVDDDYLIKNCISELYALEVESAKFDIVGIPGDFGVTVLEYIYSIVEENKDNPYNQRVWIELAEEPPDNEWIIACQLLCREARTFRNNLDLHPKNFMIRGKTLVIVDPFV